MSISSFEVIDSHTHVYPSAADTEDARGVVSPLVERTSYAGDEADALATMDANGVRRIVLLPIRRTRALHDARVAELEGEGTEVDEEVVRAHVAERWSGYNDWATDLASRNPERFRAMIGLDPLYFGAEWTRAAIERGLAAGARGLKIMPAALGCPPDDERWAVVWEAADRHGLPVVAMCGLTPYSDVAHPDRYDAVARDYPRARLVLAHAGMGAEEAVIALARRRPNVHIDTSSWFDQRMHPSWLNKAEGRSPYTHEEAAGFLREVGIGRVLFGTNWAIFPQDRQLKIVQEMPLTDSEREQVLSANYRRVFEDDD